MIIEPKYVIAEDGRIYYYSDFLKKGFIVWGIIENRFIHGVGSYIKNDYSDYVIIYEPTYKEIQDYYNKLDQLYD